MRFIDSTPKPAIETGENSTRRITFRCDDANGFEFRVLQQQDGDFWLSIVPNTDDFKRDHEGEDELFGGLYVATVRVRTPMHGGGSHERLWHVLAELFR